MKTISNATPVEHALAKDINMPLPPFAVREGEKPVPVVLERKNGKFTTAVEAEFLVNVGVINESDLIILSTVNKFVILTEYQLYSALLRNGVEIKRPILHARIKKLIMYRFLQAVRFENGTSKSGYVLALDSNGSSLLRARCGKDELVRFISYFQSIEAYKIKKNLSANQLVLMMPKDIEFCKGQLLRDCELEKNIIRTECRLHYDGNDCVVEVVRRNEQWAEKLERKLNYYDTLLKLPAGRLNISLSNPILILVAEDEYHCEEVLEIARRAQYRNIVVTCDKFTYSLTPDQAFFAPGAAPKTRFLSKLRALLNVS